MKIFSRFNLTMKGEPSSNRKVGTGEEPLAGFIEAFYILLLWLLEPCFCFFFCINFGLIK